MKSVGLREINQHFSRYIKVVKDGWVVRSGEVEFVFYGLQPR
jgi:antitoxin (DNA-binding transcriptional repressor) of toxin-antitoxin stability system